MTNVFFKFNKFCQVFNFGYRMRKLHGNLLHRQTIVYRVPYEFDAINITHNISFSFPLIFVSNFAHLLQHHQTLTLYVCIIVYDKIYAAHFDLIHRFLHAVLRECIYLCRVHLYHSLRWPYLIR